MLLQVLKSSGNFKEIMADVLGLSDVSSKDTGKGSKLKTGNLKRKYNMAGQDKKKAPKCSPGSTYDAKLKKCISVSKKKKGESFLEWRQRETIRKQEKKPLPS